MDIKKTTTTKLTIKKCHFEDVDNGHVLIDENGEEINVNDALFKLFADAVCFDVVANMKEEFDIEE